jgi:hypothetical protein
LGGDAAVSAFGKLTERDMGTATTEVIPEHVGNLIVDVFDGPSKKLLWRRTASETLSSKPGKNDKKLEHAVSEMFDHFPPRSKG